MAAPAKRVYKTDLVHRCRKALQRCCAADLEIKYDGTTFFISAVPYRHLAELMAQQASNYETTDQESRDRIIEQQRSAVGQGKDLYKLIDGLQLSPDAEKALQIGGPKAVVSS